MANKNVSVHVLNDLRAGDTKAFEIIYNTLSDKLFQYVQGRIQSREISKEIVQEIFVSLWERRDAIQISTGLEAYLYSAAKYRILSHIRKEKVREEYAVHFLWYAVEKSDNRIEEMLALADLKEVIEELLGVLPKKCQEAFRLSRFDQKSIAEIAEEMGISTRTVENYITQSLKHLRTHLTRYQWLLLIILTLKNQH